MESSNTYQIRPLKLYVARGGRNQFKTEIAAMCRVTYEVENAELYLQFVGEENQGFCFKNIGTRT
jgi:hypothetical protein